MQKWIPTKYRFCSCVISKLLLLLISRCLINRLLLKSNEEVRKMITSQVGERIRSLRKSKTGLSQEKFANEIGMDRTYFAGVESGKRNISLLNLEKIIKGLNVTFSEFFSDKWDMEDKNVK